MGLFQMTHLEKIKKTLIIRGAITGGEEGRGPVEFSLSFCFDRNYQMRYDSPKLIVGSEVRGYDSPKLLSVARYEGTTPQS